MKCFGDIMKKFLFSTICYRYEKNGETHSVIIPPLMMIIQFFVGILFLFLIMKFYWAFFIGNARIIKNAGLQFGVFSAFPSCALSLIALKARKNYKGNPLKIKQLRLVRKLYNELGDKESAKRVDSEINYRLTWGNTKFQFAYYISIFSALICITNTPIIQCVYLMHNYVGSTRIVFGFGLVCGVILDICAFIFSGLTVINYSIFNSLKAQIRLEASH